jgi:enoyl-CoA hydratase/carnithine racemase
LAEFVTIEKGLGPEGRIAVVRFDRGDGINALSPEALRQLTNAARSFEDDSETSVVVLTGAARAFSAGFDLKGRRRPIAQDDGYRFVAPAPETGTAADPRLAGDGADHHRRH